MKKAGILGALLGAMVLTASSGAFAQKLYWTTSGTFGPFNIQGLIPTVKLPSTKHPGEDNRRVLVAVSDLEKFVAAHRETV